ncbi:AMP-binding protein [Actinomadura sp. K4S16]|uniref:AMP-binding protein n=1 Tax=Actinomadura sp. K4S16 TaxID=1316147 RepID=UPI0011EE9E89|nr:AMP-binding protein [Actinomadura sp. K4S16]
MAGLTNALQYRRAGWWRDGTFLDDLRRHTRAHPGKTALVARRVGGETRALTYAELTRLADRCAGALAELGVRPGDTVAVQLTNGWEITVLALGCLRAGARICPLLPIYRRRELEVMLDLTDARVLITEAVHGGEELGELGVRLAGELPSLEHVAVSGGPKPAGALDLHAHFFDTPWEKTRADDLDGREREPDEPFLVLFTSGTTGEPKGVLHSQNTLYAAIRGEAEVFALDGSDVITMVAWNTHYTGFVRGMLMPLSLGATSVFQDSQDGPPTLEMLASYGVTYAYAPPHYLRSLVDAQRAAPRDLGMLRAVISGSAPIPPKLVEEVKEVLGLRLHSLWGMSENGAVTVSRPDDPEDWAVHSDGSPMADMELRIDPIEGQRDGSGVLWVRGPTQCLGYVRRPELYQALLDDEGWFNTDDLARDDGRGGIRITGRAKDTVMRNGLFVPDTELEAALCRHPGVGEASVIGIPVRQGADQVICAVVVPAAGEPPVTLEELRATLKEAEMTPIYWPERLELVDELPKTVTGKVQKTTLRERLA